MGGSKALVAQVWLNGLVKGLVYVLMQEHQGLGLQRAGGQRLERQTGVGK